MARRRIAEEPVSRLAAWARRVGLFSLAVVLLAVVIGRSGLLDIIPALVTFAAGIGLAIAAILLAFAAFVVIWRSGLAGFGQAVTGLLIGLALCAYPAYLVAKAYNLPVVADVSTDPVDPPRFDAIARLRTRQANPVTYAGLNTPEQLRNLHPDIEPLVLALPPQSAYAAVLAALAKRKDNPIAPLWRVIDERSPILGRRDGYIEAIAYTPIMGFRDDVAIRIRATREGSRVDVRSASRYGRWDFGVNAARVLSLLEDINDASTSIKPERPPPPKAPARKGDQRAKR
ncbi:MAG: DUF1499 domain-containing protein [Rhodoplanes sp.]